MTDPERLDKSGIPTEPIDTVLGDCPESLEHLARRRVDRAGADARKCAAMDAVPADLRRTHYLLD